MKKLLVWTIVAALALAALALIDRSCRPTDPELERVKAEYAEFKRATEAKDALEDEARAQSDAVIAKQHGIIVVSQACEAEKDALILSQKATIKALKESEPVQPELEQEPLVINLRAQVKAITRAFDLSQNQVLEQERQLKALGVPILIGYDAAGKEMFSCPEGSVTWALNEKAESWKRQYENERALRIYAEYVSEACQQAGRFERAAHDVEGLGVGVYSAVRYKDPIPLAMYAGEKLAVKVWGLFHRSEETMKVPKTVWLVALLMLIVALLWFPCAPKKISPATAYFGLSAVSGVVYTGYRFVRWIRAKVKKLSVK